MPTTYATRIRKRGREAAVALSAVILVSGCGSAATPDSSDFPSRPVELVNPWAAGGSHDAHARAIASEVSDSLGQPMSVSIKSGGAGATGATAVASRAKDDGYTLLLGDQTSVMARPMAEDLDYTWEDLRGVAQINDSPIVITVPGDSPYDTIDDFIADAKSKPGEVQYGSVTGLGPDQIPVELMMQEAGIELDHIPFEGGGPSYRAVLAGDIDMAPLFPAAVSEDIEEGRLKALAVTSPKRIDGLPDVPTLTESGIDVEWEMFRTVFVSADTPDEVVDKLAEAFTELTENEEFSKIVNGLGEDVELVTGEELDERLRVDAEALEKLVQELSSED